MWSFGNNDLAMFDPDKLRLLRGFEFEITGGLLWPVDHDSADHDYIDKKYAYLLQTFKDH